MYTKYKKDLFGYIDLIFENERLNSSDYLDSWKLIETDMNSLKNTTNLKYFLLNHFSDMKEEYQKIVKEKYLICADLQS